MPSNTDPGGPLPTVHTPMPGLVELPDALGRVLAAILATGARPYLVGGCVRDALLNPGQPPKDIDIEVFGADLPTLARALRGLGHVGEAGKSFAVLKARVDGLDVDVSVPRLEVKTGAGHAGFAVTPDPGASLESASSRREYTINALMWDPVGGDLIDCWGGLDDLHSRVLRHVGPAFVEDPLRVLRGAAFAARFDLVMHPDTVALAASITGGFPELALDRVWGVWEKIATAATKPSAALRVLADTGWETHFPELAALHGVPQDPHWHPEGDVWAHTGLAGDAAARLATDAGLGGLERAIVVLAALCHDMGKAAATQVPRPGDATARITSYGHDKAGVEVARSFLRRIGAPRTVIQAVVPLVSEHMVSVTGGTVTRSGVRRLARRLAPATVEQWAMVVAADKGGRGPGSVPAGTERWLELARDLGVQTAPGRGLLTGDHLIAAGLVPGPAFGPILRAAIAAQDGGEFVDEDGALAWLAHHTSAST